MIRIDSLLYNAMSSGFILATLKLIPQSPAHERPEAGQSYPRACRCCRSIFCYSRGCLLKQSVCSHTSLGWVLLFALGIFFAFSDFIVFAQQNGHYPLGFSGLDNSTGLPPSIVVTYLPYVNKIDALVGPTGNTLVKPDLNIVVHNVAYQVTTEKKILGATYGFAVIIPVVNTRLTANQFNASLESGGVSDIYVSPIVLGWSKGKASYLLNYGFYAPSGNFNPSASVNPGLGFWEHQIEAGAGYSFDKNKLWNASMLSTWEINQSKSGLDLKPGPMATFEYSLGRRFDQYKINLGAVGYIYHKLSPDSGSDVGPLVQGNLDRSFGIGPEFKYSDPAKHFSVDFRYERQFATESKTQGDVFVIGLSWLNIFPPSGSSK